MEANEIRRCEHQSNKNLIDEIRGIEEDMSNTPDMYLFVADYLSDEFSKQGYTSFNNKINSFYDESFSGLDPFVIKKRIGPAVREFYTKPGNTLL